ncbi:hypothetical protein NDU88_004870 [Pleurodeles waltl]|uniref:Uncharacterized protein n=1 Tax=Pleurodeles waltl TaxID=8319 RepID=A0AAV7RJE1_PLEWA|nr:hypothetical protein NDU88_004870 [Pleurodeles waltl]
MSASPRCRGDAIRARQEEGRCRGNRAPLGLRFVRDREERGLDRRKVQGSRRPLGLKIRIGGGTGASSLEARVGEGEGRGRGTGNKEEATMPRAKLEGKELEAKQMQEIASAV